MSQTQQLPRNLLWRVSLDAWDVHEGVYAASAKWQSQRADYAQQRDAVAALLRVQPAAAPPLPEQATAALHARPTSPDPLSELCTAAADEQAASVVATVVLAEICKDTRRTFQTHAWFASASPDEGQDLLERILLTWAFRYPHVRAIFISLNCTGIGF